MSHEISHKDGRAELAYAGEIPWHKLGTPVPGLLTAHDMLEAAGLLWTVGTVPIYRQYDKVSPFGEMAWEHTEIPGFKAIVREDKDMVFGVVTSKYVPIQNTEAAEVMEAVVTEGGAEVEVCGALGEGERCWMLANIPETFEVVDGDSINNYVLLAWGHDGKHGLALKLTPIRVVCNNTLTAAIGRRWQNGADLYVKHMGATGLRIAEARRAMGLVKKQVEQTQEVYQALARAKVPESVAVEYYRDVFPGPTMAELEQASRPHVMVASWEERQAALYGLFKDGKGSELAPGTMWGAYNGITEYLDHVYPVLKSGQVSLSRQSSAIFGQFNEVKAGALKLAAEYAFDRADSATDPGAELAKYI